ncbi:MAG: hypothetical protein ACR2N4_14535 [Jatrophihabitans sp.]
MSTERPEVGWTPPAPGRPAVPAPVALPDWAPVPPPTTGRRRGSGRLLAAALLCAALAVACGVVAVQRFRSDHSPQVVVARYFAALARGDAPAALALAADAPRGDYLTSDVLRQQLAVASIGELSIHSVQLAGATASVSVSYQLRFSAVTKQIDDVVNLARPGSSWRLSRVASSVSLSSASAGANRLSFAGRPLPSGQVLLFPGAMPVTSDTAAVQPDGQPSLRLADDGQVSALTTSITDPAKKALNRALTSALAGCLAGSSKDPFCPVPDDGRAVPGSLRGTEVDAGSAVTSTVLSSSAAGRIELIARVSVRGSWKVWDFNNQVVSKSGDAEVTLHALASVGDLGAVYWMAPS